MGTNAAIGAGILSDLEIKELCEKEGMTPFYAKAFVLGHHWWKRPGNERLKVWHSDWS